MRKQNGYWNDFEKVREALRPWIEKGQWPSGTTLKKAGLSSLPAVIRNHGGARSVAERIGFNIDLKECQVCHQRLPFDAFRVRKKGTEHYMANRCVKCEKALVVDYRRGTKKGFAREIYRRAKSKSERLGLPFDLTPAWINAELERLRWRCALTGIEFSSLPKSHTRLEQQEHGPGGYQRRLAVSTDRIVPELGYTMGNVRFVINHINMALKQWGAEAFEEVAIKFLEMRGFGILRP